MFTHVVTLIGPPECLFVIRNERGSLAIAANRLPIAAGKVFRAKDVFAAVSTQRITDGNHGGADS